MAATVLDASAVLALIQDEPGAELVAEHLDDSVISSVNLAEVVTRLTDIGLDDALVREVIASFTLTVEPVDESLAYVTGALRRHTRHAGLSLGDRVCLALAGRNGATALTADRAWSDLGEDLGVKIQLLR